MSVIQFPVRYLGLVPRCLETHPSRTPSLARGKFRSAVGLAKLQVPDSLPSSVLRHGVISAPPRTISPSALTVNCTITINRGSKNDHYKKQ